MSFHDPCYPVIEADAFVRLPELPMQGIALTA